MKTTNPVSFPREGVYQRSGIHIDLDCMTPGAAVYYTLDGSEPTTQSSRFRRENGLITLPEVTAQVGMTAAGTVVVKALAVADGCEPSDVVTFCYQFQRRPRDSYISDLLRPASDTAPAILRIYDFDDDELYLIVGSQRALLVDAGFDNQGDLAGYVRSLIGDLPCDAVITHAHPDHCAQAWNLSESGFPVYMDHADLDIPRQLGESDDLSFTIPLSKDMQFDLGNAVLRCYTVPGHTSGGTVLVDEVNGDAFTGDALGSNGNCAPDAQLLHLGNPEGVLDYYFPAFVQLLRKTNGCIRHIYTGHNANVIDACAYLPAVQQMLQQAVDLGEAARKPTLRPVSDGLTTSPTILSTGNFRMAGDWGAINIERMFSDGYTADSMSLLADLYVTDGWLEPDFDPHQTEYTWHSTGIGDRIAAQPMSTRIAGMTLNGEPAVSGTAYPSAEDCELVVTAPDAISKTVYTIHKTVK